MAKRPGNLGNNESETIISDDSHNSRLVNTSYTPLSKAEKLSYKIKAEQGFRDFSLNKSFSEAEFELALDHIITYLLFGTSWEENLIKDRKLRKEIPVINDISLICRGDACPLAKKCPVLKGMTDDEKEALIDTECRSERHYAIKLFADNVKNMEISPSDTPDIILLTGLVRLMIIQRRIDWLLAIDAEGGLLDIRIDAIAQLTGIVYYKRDPSLLTKEQHRVQKQINDILKELGSTRKERYIMASRMGNNKNTLAELLLKAAQDNRLAADSSVDAEFTVIDKDPLDDLE